MRISDWSSDVCSSDLTYAGSEMTPIWGMTKDRRKVTGRDRAVLPKTVIYDPELLVSLPASITGPSGLNAIAHAVEALYAPEANPIKRSEEHTSELQYLMRISYAVFSLKKKHTHSS